MISPFKNGSRPITFMSPSDEPTPIWCSDYRGATILTTVTGDRCVRIFSWLRKVNPATWHNPSLRIRREIADAAVRLGHNTPQIRCRHRGRDLADVPGVYFTNKDLRQ